MTEIITIKEFKDLDSKEIATACVNAQVIKIHEIEEGESDHGKKYTMQLIVIKDESDEMELALFGKDIDRFELGKNYEICELGLGVYNDSTVPRIIPITIIQEIPITVDHLKEIQKQLSDIPKIPIKLERLSIEESTLMYQIRCVVEKNIKQYDKYPRDKMLWDMTEEIYDKWNVGKNE